MWPFTKKPKPDAIDQAIEDFQKAERRIDQLAALIAERQRKKKTQTQLIAEAIKKFHESSNIIDEQQERLSHGELDFARNHILSSYRRDIADATR